MAKNKFLRVLSFFIFPACVFFFSEFLGIVFNAFNVYVWLDIPMHFLGGLAIAYTTFLFLRFFKEEKMIEIKSMFVLILIIVSLVVFVAVLWEFYEFLLKYFFDINTQPSLEDTLTDLFMGFLGGFFGAIVFRELISNN